MQALTESAEIVGDHQDLLSVIQAIQAEMNNRFTDLEERVTAIEKKLPIK